MATTKRHHREDIGLARAIERLRASAPPFRRPLSKAEAERFAVASDLEKLANQALLQDYRADPSGRHMPRFLSVLGVANARTLADRRSRPNLEAARSLIGRQSHPSVAAARALIERRGR